MTLSFYLLRFWHPEILTDLDDSRIMYVCTTLERVMPFDFFIILSSNIFRFIFLGKRLGYAPNLALL